MIRPFQIEVPVETLELIRRQVASYAWHEMPDDGGWNYGTNLDYMKNFSKYWIEKYDWRKTEEKMFSAFIV